VLVGLWINAQSGFQWFCRISRERRLGEKHSEERRTGERRQAVGENLQRNNDSCSAEAKETHASNEWSNGGA